MPPIVTETEYQAAIRTLYKDATARGLVLLDYLVAQPPLRYGRKELEGFIDWCLKAGAQHADVVNERIRRVGLANKEQDNAENL